MNRNKQYSLHVQNYDFQLAPTFLIQLLQYLRLVNLKGSGIVQNKT